MFTDYSRDARESEAELLRMGKSPCQVKKEEIAPNSKRGRRGAIHGTIGILVDLES